MKNLPAENPIKSLYFFRADKLYRNTTASTQRSNNTTMIKTLLLLTAAAPLLADQGYETVSPGLTFESNEEQLDRSHILAEIHGGTEGGRPITRRLRRVKKADLNAKEDGRDLNVSLVRIFSAKLPTPCHVSEMVISSSPPPLSVIASTGRTHPPNLMWSQRKILLS